VGYFRALMSGMRTARFSYLLFASLLLFFAAGRSRAFVPYINNTGQALRWNLDNSSAPTNNFNRQTKAIRYYIGGAGWSARNRTNELNAIRASFAQWQAISGTRLKFEEAGVLTGTPKFDPRAITRSLKGTLSSMVFITIGLPTLRRRTALRVLSRLLPRMRSAT
jgi:hypothetical protein